MYLTYSLLLRTWLFEFLFSPFVSTSRSAMQIFLRTVGGHQCRIDVETTTTLAELRTRIVTTRSTVSLVLGERVLPDVRNLSLADVGIEDGAVVYLIRKPAPQLLTASNDNSAKIWNSVTGDCLQTLSGQPTLWCLAFSLLMDVSC